MFAVCGLFLVNIGVVTWAMTGVVALVPTKQGSWRSLQWQLCCSQTFISSELMTDSLFFLHIMR